MEHETEIRPSVDFAVLGDAVQVVQGKLYLLGGGWDTLFVKEFPARYPTLGLGMRVRVPWSWADQVVVVSVDLHDEDGGRVLPSPPLAQGMRINRPPGMPEGSDLGVVRSFTFNNLVFPKEGAYSFVMTLNDELAARTRFLVRTRPTA